MEICLDVQLKSLVCAEWNAPDRAAASRLTETVENWAHRYNPLTRWPPPLTY